MRILLDESAPRQLKQLLLEHEVETAVERGWASKRNGELLTVAVEAGFDILFTPDANLPHQQHLAKFDIAVVVLAAGRNRMATYVALADQLREVIGAATKKGETTWFTV